MPSGDAVREVKEKLDIVELISSYVRLQRAGRDYKGLCPFHSEKSPSFTVSGEKQVWYCFGCGEGGDIFRFVEKAEGTDFPQTLQSLAEKAGVQLEDSGGSRRRSQERARAREANQLAAQYFHYILLNHRLGGRGLRYLRERAVEDATITDFLVGYAPLSRGGDNLVRFLDKKGIGPQDAVRAGLALGGEGRRVIDRFRGRLMIPIRDESGTIVGFGGRAMDSTPPKYMNSPQTSIYDKGHTIFGLSHARKAISSASRALLVEGYFDVMMAHQHGVTTAVASSGTAVTPEQLRLLRRFAEDLLLCLDSDVAGQEATRRTIELASRAGLRVRVAELPNAKDPGEFFQHSPGGWAEVEAAAQAGWEWWINQALAEHDLQRPDARAAAAVEVVMILNRIPEEAALDIYCQFAASRLSVDPARLLADVQRMRKGGPPPRPVPVEAPSQSGPGRAAPGLPGFRHEEDRLLQLLIGDRRAIGMLDALCGAEGVGNAEFLDLCARIRELQGAGGTLERHLDRFTPEEGARLARLAMAAAPWENEQELRAALSDCVDRIRLRDFETAMAEVEAKLAEGGVDGEERAQLMQRHHDLARRRANLRSRLFKGRV
ncbi:MAG: DNA primase [Candidatus Dormibacteria bacterium]